MRGIEPFESDFYGNDLVHGRGCVERRLGPVLDERELRRALVVCGSNVGANTGVMDPVTDGLGERLVEVFDETSAAKSIDTVYDGIARMQAGDIDVLVGVGSGSSITSVRLMSALEADGRSLGDLRAEIETAGSVAPAAFDGQPTPIVTVPTTFAGADITRSSGTKVSGFDDPTVGESHRIRASDARLLPTATLYDPDLFETTPTRVLAGSAMNGFDKGIETVFSRYATPVSDANAIHGLRLMGPALERLVDGDDPAILERATAGTVLVQLDRKTSIVHAFGHALSRRYDVQQGVAHGIMAPYALGYVLDSVDARREFLAAGLGIDAESLSHEATGDAIVDAVTTVRDSLGTPTRLRAVEGLDRSHFRSVAEYVTNDSPMNNAPADLDPSVDDMEDLLRRAW